MAPGTDALVGITLTVTSNADPGNNDCNSGGCTLREAIAAANTLSGADTIEFNLPGCPATPSACVISPTTALPQVMDTGLTIDGTSQPGYAGDPIVVIDGTSAGASDGLDLNADDLTVEGLVVQKFTGFGIGAIQTTYPTLTLKNNTVKDNDNSGIAASIAGPSSLLDLENNVVTGNGNFGVDASSFATVQGATVTGNTFSENDNAGLAIAVVGTFTFTGNTVNDNGSAGVNASYASVQTAMITNDQINRNHDAGLEVGAVMSLTLSGNTVTGNGSTGIAANYTSVQTASVTNNQVNNNDNDGIQLAVVNQLTATGNTVDGNSAVGVAAFYTTTTTASFTSNHVNDNNDAGLQIATSDTLTFTGNTVTGNGDTGVNATYTTVQSANVQNNTSSGNAGYGVAVYASDTMVVSGNTVTDNAGDGLHTSGSTANTATITDNEFGGNQGVGGGAVIAAHSLMASGNNFHNNLGNGLDASPVAVTSATITGNTFFLNGQAGLNLKGAGIGAHFNRFAGNAVGVFASAGSAVDATENWWGCNGGPSDASCDPTQGPVSFDPWLVLGITADPSTVSANGSSAITGDLTRDSNGADTSGIGHLPDGTGVLFGANLGSLDAPLTQPLANGKAHTNFNAGANPGTAHVSATLDNQTVETDVIVQPPEATSTPTAAPTATAGALLLQGDLDCDGDVDTHDALIPFAFAAGLPHPAAGRARRRVHRLVATRSATRTAMASWT